MVGRHQFDEHVYKNHWLTTYRATGRDFDFYQPAYRFGYDLARAEGTHSRGWEAFEAQARDDWAKRFPNVDWSEVRDAIKHAWESAPRDREDAEQDALDRTGGEGDAGEG